MTTVIQLITDRNGASFCARDSSPSRGESFHGTSLGVSLGPNDILNTLWNMHNEHGTAPRVISKLVRALVVDTDDVPDPRYMYAYSIWPVLEPVVARNIFIT